MSVSATGPCLPPSSSLLPIRQISAASEDQIKATLGNLLALYCPLRFPAAIQKPKPNWKHIPAATTPAHVDSGYVSRDERQCEDDIVTSEEVTAALRADPFEKRFTTRWLTSLISRVEEMGFDEDVATKIVDDAAFILSSFSDSTQDQEEVALTREFSFPTTLGKDVNITLNDAPLSGVDHTDVGLQSWGASIVLSSMMCLDPAHFGLSQHNLPALPKIIELGAGTGLVSLTLAKLLPRLGVQGASIVASDYHPAVLENCKLNVATNFPSKTHGKQPVTTRLLDWAKQPPGERASANFLVASDVIYAPEHAVWLRNCAAYLLRPGGTFWLMVTVRKTGKFEGIPETVEAAFEPESCPVDEEGRTFGIDEKVTVKKRKGIGRGDELGYNLYKIAWDGQPRHTRQEDDFYYD
jgi:hypothetical protein